MYKQISVALLFFSVILLPVIPVSADNPDDDDQLGYTEFSWVGTASTVELAGEWDWSNTIFMEENDGIWSTQVNLSEGMYCYKFVIDGEFTFDPSNPYRGYCNDIENSIIRVKDSNRPNFHSEIIDHQLIITFVPGVGGAGPNGVPSGLENAIWDPVNLTWSLNLTTLDDGKHSLKLEINDTDGNQAYDHLVPFWVGSQSEFSWEDSLIYMIMTDRFINGNTSNDGQPTGAAAGADWMGGDIEGVTQKIQSGYFADLGVNALWLTPFNTNAQGTGLAADGVHNVAAYHGYWPIEPRQVDPRLGTAEQLKEMVDVAHSAGIRVMMDYVVNHVHEDHTYYQDNPEWFNQGCICGTTDCDWTERRLDCQFTSYMPDVNWKIREASEQFIEDALWWLEEFDLDGARIDAVKHVDDLAATNLATRINERFETVGTDYYLKGETAMGWSGDNLADNQYQYDTINRYIGENSLDGQADFVLYHAVVDNVFTQGARNYQHLDYWTARSQDQYVPGSIMVPYVGSHDVPRLTSRADGGTGDAYNQWQEQGLPGQPGNDDAYQAALQAYGWLLTTPGAPLLYYGDEYGEYGAADPDNRHMYRDSSNWNERESGLFENISTLGKLRFESIALKQGTYSSKYATPDMLIYDMSHSNQNMSIILNRGTQTTYNGFSDSDLVRFGEATIASGIISIPANSVTVVELNPSTIQNEIPGCTDSAAINFDPAATEDDGSCQYPVEPVLGCTNSTATNYDPNATEDDGSCQYSVEPVLGCTNTTATNYDPNATEDDGSCEYPPVPVLGCTDNYALNYDSNATGDDGSCEFLISGGRFVSAEFPLFGTYSPHVTTGHEEIIQVRFNSDGSKYATIERNGINELQIRDTATKQLLANSTAGFDSEFTLSFVLDLDWSPDDQTVALLSHNGSINLYNAETGELTNQFQSPSLASGYSIHVDHAEIEFNPNGSIIAIAGLTHFVLVNSTSGDIMYNHSGSSIFSVSWHPSGNKLVFSGSGNLNFYDIEAQEIVSISNETDYISKVAYSPDGQMVVGCDLPNSRFGMFGSTTVFDEASGEVMWTKVTTPLCRDIAWSPDSSLIAIAYNSVPEHRDENGHPVFDYNGPYVDILVASNGSYFDQLDYICMSIYHCASITSLDWHPNSQSIIAGGNSNFGFTNPIGPSPNHIVGVVSSWYFDPSLEAIFGCMDEKSSNYNPLANASDYSCLSYYGTTQTDGSNNQYDSENGITPVNVDDLLDDSSRTQTEPIIQWIRNILFIAVCIGFVILLLGANRYKR